MNNGDEETKSGAIRSREPKDTIARASSWYRRASSDHYREASGLYLVTPRRPRGVTRRVESTLWYVLMQFETSDLKEAAKHRRS